MIYILFTMLHAWTLLQELGWGKHPSALNLRELCINTSRGNREEKYTVLNCRWL